MTLNNPLVLVGATGLALLLLLIGGGVALKFLVWAFGATIRLSLNLIKALSAGLIKVTAFAATVIWRLIREASQYTFELIITAILEAVTPLLKKLRATIYGHRDEMREKRKALMASISNPDLIESQVKDINPVPMSSRVEPVLGNAVAQPSDAEYRNAVAVLGLDAVSNFTSVDLKLRYSKLINSFSSEEAETAKAMTDQVKTARDVIKKVRGWI
ncbi:hypothetical protein ACO0LM_22355 [Undibacterium sp. Di26W]|uniref:hypothetical protein n=1 Tax=Undibacterium sp. Di26W TaxID=3413035 RepID=UPI003BF0974A